MDNITQSSFDTSKNVNNLSTQIQGLIDALTKFQTPICYGALILCAITFQILERPSLVDVEHRFGYGYIEAQVAHVVPVEVHGNLR